MSKFDLEYWTDVCQWDVFNWQRAFQFWQDNTKLDLPSCIAIELGAREGGASVFLGQKCKYVICSDLTNPVQNASALHHKYNLTNIEYEALDITMPYWHKSYDLILSKSVIGACEKKDHNRIIDNIFDALNPGGEFWFAENLSATFIHQFARKHFVKWGERWNYWDIGHLPTSLDRFTSKQITTIGFMGTFGRTPAQRNFLGKLDANFFDYFISENWRYIAVGVCRKD